MRAALRRMTGDFAGSLNDLDKAIEIKPDGELYEQRASVGMMTRRDFSLNLLDLDQAIAAGRKYEKVYSMRGLLRGQNGDIDGAIADYQAAIGLRPDLAQPHIGLASMYQRKNDDEKAASVLEQFIEYRENSGKKISGVKGEITASTYTPVPQLSTDDVTVGQGSVIFKVETSGNATLTQAEMERMTERMEQAKNISQAYKNLAAIYERQKKYEAAMLMVEKGISLDQSDFVGYEVRGKIKLATGDYEGALVDLNKSIGMNAPVYTNYVERGIAYLMLEKKEAAQKDFDKYLQAFPKGVQYLEKRIAEANRKLESQ